MREVDKILIKAKKQGLNRYFTGAPCKFGHISDRYVYNNKCCTCHHILTVKKRTDDRKAKMFKLFGNKCKCCDESELTFLCIDHVNGGGREHRRLVGGNFRAKLYRWMIEQVNKFGIKTVSRDFRILCWNCNAAFSILGYCPHHKPKEVKNVAKRPR